MSTAPKLCHRCSNALTFDPACGGMVCLKCLTERQPQQRKPEPLQYDPAGLHHGMTEAQFNLALRLEERGLGTEPIGTPVRRRSRAVLDSGMRRYLARKP